MDKRERAVNYFERGYNCSQAVLAAFCEELGISEETALKVATGFGGGMRQAEVCGAVTGALMVIGLKYGHFIEGDNASKQKAYALTEMFQEKFRNLNNTVLCRELLGYDLSKADEMSLIRDKGLFQTICPKMIQDAVDILEGMGDIEIKK